MLQLGDEVFLYSAVFVVVLLGTRSPLWTTALTASLYLFLTMFRFPQVPTSRSRQVLHPERGAAGSGKVSVIAHRGGGHDAPENTIAAIQEVRGGWRGSFFLHMSGDGLSLSQPLSVTSNYKGHSTAGGGHTVCKMHLQPSQNTKILPQSCKLARSYISTVNEDPD